MEGMQGVKGYSDSREEEEEEEEAAEEIIITREESSSRLHHQQDEDNYAASNFINHTKQIDFMDLSLRNNNNNKDMNMNMNVNGTDDANFQLGGSGSGHATTSSSPTEKEHMFDKVVTPSDVGKLNRLVIPKQHAEKYFPLDSTSNEKGLLLNFEDRNGKLWRFRYSYWNSSQSYVMTKGWSRFVKEKKLDAGDIVSFKRGVGDLYRHRLYIDWRRRPDIQHGPDPSTTLITPLFLPNHQPHHLSQYSIRWGGRLYSLPSVSPPVPPRHQHHHDNHNLQQLNCNNMYPYGSGTHHHYNYNHELNSGSGSFYYLRSIPSMPMGDHQSLMARQQQEEGGNNNIAPMIIDSVPISHPHHQLQHHGGGSSSSSSNTNTAAKRLRLFGVNMECATSPSEDPKCCNLLNSASVPHVTMVNSLPSSSLPPLQRLRVPHHEDPSPSMLFDLDPSLQYRK